MALSKQDLADIAQLIRALPSVPEGPTPESVKREQQAQDLRDRTHKSKRFAYYIAGNQGAYVGGKLYRPGELIQLPVDKLPSYTWKATDERGKELAEKKALDAKAEAEELARLARDEDDEGAPLDETEPPADEVDEEPAPTPPAKGKAAKPVAKPAKGKAGKRAADTDIE